MDVKIYTTNSCSFCRSAKALLTSKQIAFEEIDCSSDASLRQWLVEKTGQRTVPQIFFDDAPIGGFSDLSELNRSGELDRILAGEAKPEPIG